ncbi:MAG: hypothetical protein F6K16_34580 [Symploca sp. SIO2B6]|nr:hypothetical protein [Symploca sp. SIO2B6]
MVESDAIDIDITSALAERAYEYTFASLDEILDLLGMVVEPYNSLNATLSSDLRRSAQEEMQFFRNLLQQRLGALMVETGLNSPNLSLAA